MVIPVTAFTTGIFSQTLPQKHYQDGTKFDMRKAVWTSAININEQQPEM
jgi:hypothetical protein